MTVDGGFGDWFMTMTRSIGGGLGVKNVWMKNDWEGGMRGMRRNRERDEMMKGTRGRDLEFSKRVERASHPCFAPCFRMSNLESRPHRLSSHLFV